MSISKKLINIIPHFCLFLILFSFFVFSFSRLRIWYKSDFFAIQWYLFLSIALLIISLSELIVCLYKQKKGDCFSKQDCIKFLVMYIIVVLVFIPVKMNIDYGITFKENDEKYRFFNETFQPVNFTANESNMDFNSNIDILYMEKFANIQFWSCGRDFTVSDISENININSKVVLNANGFEKRVIKTNNPFLKSLGMNYETLIENDAIIHYNSLNDKVSNIYELTICAEDNNTVVLLQINSSARQNDHSGADSLTAVSIDLDKAIETVKHVIRIDN